MDFHEVNYSDVEKISETGFKFIGRYTTENNFKYYIFLNPELRSKDYGFEQYKIFVAIPKIYDKSFPDPPEIVFAFGVGKLFLNVHQLEPNLNEYLEKYGDYFFKKWLNQITEIKSQENKLILTAGDEENNPIYSNGKLKFPIDTTDDERLEKIAHNKILESYFENRGRGPIEILELRERCFVPDYIFNHVIGLIRSNGLIEEGSGSLSLKGTAIFKNIEEKGEKVNDSSITAFVAQAFNDEMENIYLKVFEPVVRSFRLNPIKINDEDPDDPIDVAILNQILQSRFLICDLTFGRPSVYFEAGYALGTGIKVFYTAREDHNSDSENYNAKKNKIHFDLRNRQITWWNEKELDKFKEELFTRIERHLDLKKKNAH